MQINFRKYGNFDTKNEEMKTLIKRKTMTTKQNQMISKNFQRNRKTINAQ